MRASELLGRRVRGPGGEPVGIVHDVRVAIASEAGGVPELRALVVGPDTRRCRTAHAWGYAQGRTVGPWPLRLLLGGEAARTAAIPVEHVAAWDDGGQVRLAQVGGGR